jgi:transposase
LAEQQPSWSAEETVIQSRQIFYSVIDLYGFPFRADEDLLRENLRGFAMSQGIRLLRPDRGQLRWDRVDLDSQLPPDHRARLVWAFVGTLELSAFHARIKARDDLPGRPAADPAVLLALWLHATLEGIGSARAIERLCQQHAAYRWLAGGVPINHDMLSAFRRDNGPLLDGLLTQSLTALIAEGLISLEEMAIDGTKIRACAGRSSLAGRERLGRIETAVAERVATLKTELEQDAGAVERQRQAHALRVAQARAMRLERAKRRLAELEQEKVERARRRAQEEAAKSPPSVSTSDPEVRQMRMADGATHPAWNVQVATATGFVVTIEPTDRRNDSGLAAGLVAQVEQRCGRVPKRLLADATAMTVSEIATLAERCPDLQVYSPPAKQRGTITQAAARNRRSQLTHEPPAVKDWRSRMASEAGKDVYRRRKLTEHAHAKMKNRGFGRVLVHGIAKVRSVCLLQAIAHNLLHAQGLRCAAA